jgi:hypothetical protein
MSAVRSLMSVRMLLVGLALGSFGASTLGCYDLSTTGPHPEDFVRDRNETETQEQGQTEQRAGAPAKAAANAAVEEKRTAVVEVVEALELVGARDVSAFAARKHASPEAD